jgi:hypothetical protein
MLGRAMKFDAEEAIVERDEKRRFCSRSTSLTAKI